jgi:septin 7
MLSITVIGESNHKVARLEIAVFSNNFLLTFSWAPVIDFVESKYEEYLTAESRVHRKAMSDSRVHSCLYFIAPSGHGLKPLDVEFMQRLCDKVNIIPVIAKADTMTPEEIQLFKKQILNEIAQHKIKIYDFPEPLEEEEDAKALKQLKCRVPFAVVGANAIIEVDGKKIRGRRYPWGVAEGKLNLRVFGFSIFDPIFFLSLSLYSRKFGTL